MPDQITLRVGDSYAIATPIAPEPVRKMLTYWHKAFEYDEARHQQVVTGSTKALYSLREIVDQQTGQQVDALITFPGFAGMLRDKYQELGCQVAIVDERLARPPADLAAALIGMREYQYDCVYTALNSGGGIIACPCGWGKTHVIGSLIRGYNQELLKLRGTPMTLVVTPSLDISLKNYNDLVPMLPGREVGLVNTDHKTYSDDVQVITPESLGNIDITGVGLMIYDEVHTLTHSRMELLAGAARAMRFGTSATPKGRFDNADLLIRGMFGPVIYSRTYEEAVQDGAVVPIRVYWVECPKPRNWPEGGYHTKPGGYRNGLWRNRDFNTLIASILMNAPQTMQALCVVDKLDHMDNIVGRLPGITYVHGTTSQKEMDAKRLKNIAAVAKKDRTKIYDGMASGETKRAISTGIYRQGINFKELAILVNAEGMGSEIIAGQLPGRTSRNIDGKDMAFIVDFHHPWDMITRKDGSRRKGMLLSDDRAREKVYTELKFEQVWVPDISQMEFN